jgi:hypothetical protein
MNTSIASIGRDGHFEVSPFVMYYKIRIQQSILITVT